MKQALQLPPQDVLTSLLDYNEHTGQLVWKARCNIAMPWLNQKRLAAWNTKYAGRFAFTAKSVNGYRGAVLGTHYTAHRLIWKLVHGTDPEIIDHINGDKFDNQIGNLRDATVTENNRNRALPSNNMSGVIGVRWCKRIQKWRAHIADGTKPIHLGVFDLFSDAVKARKDAEAAFSYGEYHGRATK